jgi:hypothetical protein
MPRMEMFLLCATLGVYAVGVIAVVFAALLFAMTGDYKLGCWKPSEVGQS